MILVTCTVSGLPQSIHKQCLKKIFHVQLTLSMFQPDIVAGLVIQLENGILFLVALIYIQLDAQKTFLIHHNGMSYHRGNLYITMTQLVHI